MKKQEEKEFKQKIKERRGLIRNNNHAITLIALVITVVLNATRGHCEECIA